MQSTSKAIAVTEVLSGVPPVLIEVTRDSGGIRTGFSTKGVSFVRIAYYKAFLKII